MSKLYPPVLEGTLPAFYSNNEGIVTITIPFSMNRGVSPIQVGGFELKIKSLQTGTVLYTLDTFKVFNYSLEKGNCYVSFLFKDEKKQLKPGLFYKLQLAYISVPSEEKEKLEMLYQQGKISLEEYEDALQQRSEVGYFTGMSISKYTTKPDIEIKGMDKKFINPFQQSFTGVYKQTNGRDITEKVYSYRFDIYNDENILTWTSGQCLHNNSLDANIDMSEDHYALNSEVQNEKVYYIQYTITTINNLTLSTPLYKMVQREYVEPELNRTISTKMNFDEGFIDLFLDGEKNENGSYPFITGSFVLVRSDSNSNYTEWRELKRLKFNYESPPSGFFIYRDYLIEQGKKYKYAIYQYNDNDLVSKKVYSEEVQADFEDAFLSDGKRHLKLKYNLTMPKFSNVRLEQKTDTLGGKHPFIFRSGHTDYYEFNISGLISYFMDEANTFINKEDLLTEEKTINYTTDNVAQERVFKREVLSWLNDGEAKLFRSPTEGNFIIRLLKISLKPEQKLGRLLHNFSASAYEVADYNYENLCKYGFITPGDIEKQILQFETVPLKDYKLGNPINRKNNLQTVSFTDMYPGTKILITFQDSSQEEIRIGITGNYNLENPMGIQSLVINPEYQEVYASREAEYKTFSYYMLKDGQYINVPYSLTESGPTPPFNPYEVYYRISNLHQRGSVTYSYFSPQENVYEKIDNVHIPSFTMSQFIGTHDLIKEITNIKIGKTYTPDIKKEIIKYYHLIVRPRPIEYYQRLENNFIIYNSSAIPMEERHPFSLMYNVEENRFSDFSNINVDNKFDCDSDIFYLDSFSDYNPQIVLNNEIITVDRELTIDLSVFDSIDNLYTRNGVVAELVYQTREIEYKVEQSNKNLVPYKERYLEAKKNFEEALKNPQIDSISLEYIKNSVIQTYSEYVSKVKETIEKGELL